MKKFSVILTILSVSSPLLTMAAITPGQIPSAQDLGLQEAPVETPSQLMGVIADIVGWAYTIFFVVAVLFIIFAAFNYLTASGNPEKIKTAHSQLMWAIVAIVVALMAVGIRMIIEHFLTYEQ
jgi:heme/copper-type cytochrome/quinol oxidase subunit 2